MPSVSKEKWEIVKQIYLSNKKLPWLPPEIWIMIFDIRDAIIKYENNDELNND